MQANTIRTDAATGKLRPVMRPVAYRIPNDGKSPTLACCNLEILGDYGIELGWVTGWTPTELHDSKYNITRMIGVSSSNM